jgi:hypothetical protein
MGEFKHATADAVLLYLIPRWHIYSTRFAGSYKTSRWLPEASSSARRKIKAGSI